MPQFLRPDSNVTQTSWTNGFAELDEATASDVDFSYGANNSSAARLEVGTSNPAKTPNSAGTCTVRWRHAKVSSGTLSGTGGTVTQTCGVYQGASLLSSSQVTTGGTWTAASFTFNASLVSDWTDLRLRFTQSASGGGGNARGSAVSWAELEAPDAAFSLVADKGTFTETGVAANLLHKAVLVASAGSFVETGKDAALVKKRNLVADKGSFTLSGVDATLSHTAKLVAGTGLYSVSGITANVLHGALLSSQGGSLAVSGQSVQIERNAILYGEFGSFNATGVDADITYALNPSAVITAEPGEFTVIDGSAPFASSYSLDASTGAFTVPFSSSNRLSLGRRLIASPRKWSILKKTVSIEKGSKISSAPGSYAITGYSSQVQSDYPISAVTRQYTFSGPAASIRASHSIAASTGSCSVSVNGVLLLIDAPLLASGRAFVLTGRTASVKRHAVLLAETGHSRIKPFKSRLRTTAAPKELTVYAGGFVDNDPYLKVRHLQNRYNLPARIVQPTLRNPF